MSRTSWHSHPNMSSLQGLCLLSFMQRVKAKLKEKTLDDSALRALEGYIKKSLPEQFWDSLLAQLITVDDRMTGVNLDTSDCAKSVGNEYSNGLSSTEVTGRGSYYHYNRLRLEALFAKTDVILIFDSISVKYFDSFDFSKSENMIVSMLEYHDQTGGSRAICDAIGDISHHFANQVCTMTSLRSLRLNIHGNDEILRLISRTCPHLETLIAGRLGSSYTHNGIIGFCGFAPSKTRRFEDVRGFLHKSKAVCVNLKRLKLVNTNMENWQEYLAMLLCVFPKLEEVSIGGNDYCVINALTTIYGSNEQRYHHVTKRYQLRRVDGAPGSMTYSPAEWSLLSQVCPGITRLSLRLSSVERFARNVLATLLHLQQLECLSVFDCNLDALLWFLEKRGASLKVLRIMTSNPSPSWENFSRSHLSLLARYCPNLQNLLLLLPIERLVNDLEQYPVSPGVEPFPHLTELYFGSKNGSFKMDLIDWQFLFSAKSLRVLHLGTMQPLSNRDTCTLLDSPCFRSIEFLEDNFFVESESNLAKLRLVSPKLRIHYPTEFSKPYQTSPRSALTNYCKAYELFRLSLCSDVVEDMYCDPDVKIYLNECELKSGPADDPFGVCSVLHGGSV